MTDLRHHYLAYLARLDARDFAGLAPFVADRVTHNGHALTREGYGAMIATAIEPTPDLRFVPESVLVEGGLSGEARVAARLAFSCTPLRPFLGLPPHGGAVHFTEHAFYRLVDGRIAEVWSLLDRAAVEAQLGG